MLMIDEVSTEQQIEQASKVAAEIWNSYWPDLIGQAQTDYMVSNFQSKQAIQNDIMNKGYTYYLLNSLFTGATYGYTAAAIEGLGSIPVQGHGQVVYDKYSQRLFISKIYLYPEHRGKHLSSAVIRYYEDYCRDNALEVMYLTVNRENELAIRAYKANGFEVIEEVDNPIGEGFYMRDYIMAKEVNSY